MLLHSSCTRLAHAGIDGIDVFAKEMSELSRMSSRQGWRDPEPMDGNSDLTSILKMRKLNPNGI